MEFKKGDLICDGIVVATDGPVAALHGQDLCLSCGRSVGQGLPVVLVQYTSCEPERYVMEASCAERVKKETENDYVTVTVHVDGQVSYEALHHIKVNVVHAPV